MILLIKKVENRSIKKQKKQKSGKLSQKKKKWKTNVREKCGCWKEKVFFFFNLAKNQEFLNYQFYMSNPMI